MNFSWIEEVKRPKSMKICHEHDIIDGKLSGSTDHHTYYLNIQSNFQIISDENLTQLV